MKLLLADDLHSAHQYLENCVDWSKEDIYTIYHAYNGHECVELTERYRPDILILDIKMPIYDGIEVLRRLSELDCMPHVLVISAYDDFQYARQSLKFGVDDYLTKPINLDQLLQSIREIVSTIRQQCLNRIRSHLLELPIESEQSYIQEDLQRLDLEWAVCALIEISGNMLLIRDIRETILREHRYSIALTDTEILVILPAPQDGPSPGLPALEQYVQQVAQQGVISIHMGVSDLVHVHEDGLQTAYSQSCDAAANRYYAQQTIFYYSRLSFGSIDQMFIGRCKFSLAKAMLENRQKDVQNIVNDIFSTLEQQTPSRRQVIDACYSILIYCINYLFISYNSPHEDISERQMLDRLEGCSSVQELRNAFSRELTDHMTSGNTSPKSQMIVELEQYLQENYRFSLTLEKLSSTFFISKYELCRKFKAEVGKNLWEYIVNLRISNAKQLLLHSDLHISEIAEAVGYNNPTYFSSLFKKQEGISPKQYRKQGAGGRF